MLEAFVIEKLKNFQSGIKKICSENKQDYIQQMATALLGWIDVILNNNNLVFWMLRMSSTRKKERKFRKDFYTLLQEPPTVAEDLIHETLTFLKELKGFSRYKVVEKKIMEMIKNVEKALEKIEKNKKISYRDSAASDTSTQSLCRDHFFSSFDSSSSIESTDEGSALHGVEALVFSNAVKTRAAAFTADLTTETASSI